ncbi:hypothetical protein HYZ98_03625 [Candidatus Peregrinibacteria bacterium]|nr:hypothetical protein [Candidatus Peregrinibacteria bacterium]
MATDRLSGWCDLTFPPGSSSDTIQSFLQDSDHELREWGEELVILSMRRDAHDVLHLSLCARVAPEANDLCDDTDLMW